MLDTLLSMIAPHHCSGCGQIGTLLCHNCKYDIIEDAYGSCVACAKGIGGGNGLCSLCSVPYVRAWCIAERRDSLEALINAYKFENAKSAYISLAELLHASIPELPPSVRIMPVPTIATHIRQRGYDHTLLIARHFARMRGLSLDASLKRRTSTMQRGASKRDRTQQAKQAFVCPTLLNPDAIYLLVDDVMTTGATMKYAAQALCDAGATSVWIASIGRQPLD